MTTVDRRSIPITQDGQLIPDAGMLVLGYMLYPNCERSAHQFARIVSEETVEKARNPRYQPGQIFNELMDVRLVARLLLAGHVAGRVCKNYMIEGSANFNKAAHVVSELNATNKTVEGKALPTEEGRLRKTYSEYEASIHFWAAANSGLLMDDATTLSGIDVILSLQVAPDFLGRFLSVAKHFEEILALAKPRPFFWSAADSALEIWDLDKFPKPAMVPDTIDTSLALSTYKSRSKG